MRVKSGHIIIILCLLSLLCTACGQSGTSVGGSSENSDDRSTQISTEAESVFETEPEFDLNIGTESEKEAESESGSELEEEPETESGSEPEKESGSEFEKESETESESESEKESESELESESEKEPESESEIPHTHSYSEKITVAPSCEKAGTKKFSCKCGDSYTEKIPATGHKYGDYKYNNDATYTADGTETSTCICGKKKIRTVKGTKLSYTYTNLDKSLYANDTATVRDLPSADGKKLGKLSKSEEVKVTGQCNETGWYRIDYKGNVGYVNSKYLQRDEKRDLLNAESLNPKASPIKETDELIDKIFAEIFTKNMTTYDKVKACYDYLINNCTYGLPYECDFGFQIYFEYGEEYYYTHYRDIEAYEILSTGLGVCDHYSSAFMVMMRKIGLNCQWVAGIQTNSSGESSGHAWTEIIIDGKAYIFDPQIEDRIVERKGKWIYDRFYKTYEELPGKYTKD